VDKGEEVGKQVFIADVLFTDNPYEDGILFRGHPFMTSTRREKGVRLRWTHVDGGDGGPAPCERPHRKLKLESTDVILSSSHAKKLASFLPEFRFWTEKSRNLSAI